MLLGAGIIVVVIVVVGVIGVLHIVRLQRRLDGLSASIQVAQNEAETGQLGAAQTQLAAVDANLTSVNSTLYSSRDITLLSDLPVARQNLDAVRSGTQLALQLVSAGQQIFHAATPLESPSGHLDVSLRGGKVPVAAIQNVQTTLASVLTDLPTRGDPPGGTFVLGRVRAAEDRVWAEAAQRRAELTSVDQGLQLLNAIAGGNGESRYLIAVANTAEMRGAGGMILSYGVLDVHQGQVSLGQFGPIDQLALSHPAAAQFPTDFTQTYGAFQPNQDWRNATIMSDFTVDGPVLASMYTEATGLPVNGVFQVDPEGLAAVLAGTGPITVPGLGLVDAANVVPLTLNQEYVQFPAEATRKDYLTTVARAAFAQLTSGDLPSLRLLGTALVEAAKQRHIILSFTAPDTQRTVHTLGLDGALPSGGTDFAQLTVQNFGGDKMDYYLDSALTVTGTTGSKTGGQITATITLRNTAPPGGTPPYIFGPDVDLSDPPGTYRGLVTLYLPPLSDLTGATTDTTAVTSPDTTTQNGDTAITFYVDIPAGAQSTTSLRAQLPARGYHSPFVVVPTPRVNATVVVNRVH